MTLEDEQKFVKGMNRLIRTCQGSAVLIFISIYFLGLTKEFIKEQLFVSILCVIAEILIIVAKNNIEKKTKESKE